MAQGRDPAGRGEQTSLPGLINLADEACQAEPAARGHIIKNRPEFWLQRYGRGVSG